MESVVSENEQKSSHCVFILQATDKVTKKELKAYAKSGAIAAEVFSSIKTVHAFSGQHKEWNR